jgi:1,4-dihydroxy-2-naphthoate octaprenyltransferase
MPHTIEALVRASRPKFLILAPICVLLGVSAVDYHRIDINPWIAISCVLIAFFAHISVNLLNEYQDAKSGLDDDTIKTPFSGGSGALQQYPASIPVVRVAGISSAFLVCFLGVYIALKLDPWLLLVGLIGITIVLSYTPWLNEKPWLCLFAPGLAFGSLMVVGTYAALSGRIDTFAMLLSIPVLCLVNNLLLLNQFPDADADQRAGRQHFVIRYGYKISVITYIIFAVTAYLVILFMLITKQLPQSTGLTLIGLPISLFIAFKALRFTKKHTASFLPIMGLNVMITLCVPLILAISLFIA